MLFPEMNRLLQYQTEYDYIMSKMEYVKNQSNEITLDELHKLRTIIQQSIYDLSEELPVLEVYKPNQDS